MRKRAPTVEWHIVERDADWERVRGAPLPDSGPGAHRRLSLNRFLWAVATIVCLLASAGGWWWWYRDQAEWHQATAEGRVKGQQELETVVQQDHRSVTSGAGDHNSMNWQNSMTWWYQHAQEVNSLRAAVQTSDPAAHLDIVFHSVAVQGKLAMARVVTHPESGVLAYRQTRFYRRTDAGWLPTTPDATLWGPERSLETPSFVFHFRQSDAQTVIAVAPQVETLYTTLRRDFGLPLPSSAEKLIIEVSVTQSPGDPRFEQRNVERLVMANRLIVASPGIYWAPVELTDAELLAQSIILPLLTQLSAEGSEQHRIGAAWQPMMSGLQLWHVWEMALPLAAWREGVVQWIYLDLPGTSSNQAVVLPERYEELCASHRLWLQSPTALGIPLLCTELDGEEWYFAVWGPRHPLTRLDQLTLPMRPDEAMESNSRTQVVHPPGQTVALATLIEYVVATYGRERLPLLVTGLGQYNSWETLLPAVYGVSATKFEAGWQAYLVAHYGAVSAR